MNKESMNGSVMDRIIKLMNQLMRSKKGEVVELDKKVKNLEDERLKLLGEIERLKNVAKTVNRLEMELIEAVAKKADLEGKIKALTNQKELLLKTIEDLKGQLEIKDLEAAAIKLENEVSELRGEEKGLREKLEKITQPVTNSGQ